MIFALVPATSALIFASFGVGQQVPMQTQRTIADIQASQIAGNVPPRTEFSSILERDLKVYFAEQGVQNPAVQFELLRQGPTQIGVSYPKFYLWVWVWTGAKPALSGAIRVAAIDRKRFLVTNFLKREDILGSVDQVGKIFPAALATSIRAHAASAAYPRR